jgi:hypothetical protein
MTHSSQRRLSPVMPRFQIEKPSVQYECAFEVFTGFEQHRLFAHPFLNSLWSGRAATTKARHEMSAGAILKPSPQVRTGRTSRFPFSWHEQRSIADICCPVFSLGRTISSPLQVMFPSRFSPIRAVTKQASQSR